jgi:hypothetical protein
MILNYVVIHIVYGVYNLGMVFLLIEAYAYGAELNF